LTNALTQLLLSDLDYFRLGAQRRPLPGGGELFRMEGCERLAAGCVAFPGENPHPIGPDRWVEAFEGAVREAGAPLARLYLQGPQPDLTAALERGGYTRKRETAYLSPAAPPPPVAGYRLRPIESSRDWDDAHAVFAELERGPDGYENPAALWLDLIRRKCAGGQMRYYVVEDQQGVCGTVGSMEYRDMLRLKNLMIRPARRRNGAGRATALLLRLMAARQPGRVLGVFGIDGSPGAEVYQSAGLFAAGHQEEWTRWLTD
jgi:hypothetical protein